MVPIWGPPPPWYGTPAPKEGMGDPMGWCAPLGRGPIWCMRGIRRGPIWVPVKVPIKDVLKDVPTSCTPPDITPLEYLLSRG